MLKEVHPDQSLSNKAIVVLDGFVKDMQERITREASVLCRLHKKATLTSREVSCHSSNIWPAPSIMQFL